MGEYANNATWLADFQMYLSRGWTYLRTAQRLLSGRSIQNVYDSSSILKKGIIVRGKLISYEYNSENLDKTADLPKFHKKWTYFNDTKVLSP